MINRAIRCNNPLHLRLSDNPWKGKLPSTDPELETFDTAMFGIRAGAKTLLSFADENGKASINTVITRFAAAADFTLLACIEDVEEVAGYDRTLILDLHEPYVLARVVQALITHLNRSSPYSIREVATAIQLALV